MANDYGEGHFLLVITLNQSNRGNTPFCGGKFERRLRFLPFCDILFVRHNFIEVHNGVQFCDFVLLFSVMDKIVSQQCEVHFRGVLHVVRHTFFILKKIFQKFLKKYRRYQLLIHRFDIMK